MRIHARGHSVIAIRLNLLRSHPDAGMEQIMASVAAQNPPVPSSPAPATVADVMRRPMTAVDQYDHVAAAAYLMKHAATSVLMVVDTPTGQTVGIITEGDVAHTVADGKDVNDVRVHAAMTTRPAVIEAATSIRDAAKIMTRGHFRHLPVGDRDGLLGTVDINDVCRALIGAGEG
jgi:signal-transduction protein with cAMP-binding, CBS, and nucleotidyltransferase domain